MKSFLFIFAVLILAIKSPAADAVAASPLKIGTADATNHYGQEMVVTGKVAQVTIRPTVTFLNLHKPFPNSPFSVVIFHGHSSFFGDANALKGKTIEIKGKIKNYHDRPEIILNDTNQLTVPGLFQSTNAPTEMPATNFPEIM
jgi:hypothetical protein